MNPRLLARLDPPPLKPVGGLLAELVAMSSKELDTLPFGVIQFSEHYIVERYNYCEAVNTGLSAEKVVGLHVFTQLAQCMNNFMVAQRFEDAILNNMALDETLDYVLTWRMRPTPILLRLLWNPQASQSGFLVLHRLS